MANPLAIIAYTFVDKPGNTGRIEAFPPNQVIADCGAEWEPGLMPDVFGPGYRVAYITKGDVVEIAAAFRDAGHAIAHPISPQALLAKCKQHPLYADFKDELRIEDGRIVFPPPEDFF